MSNLEPRRRLFKAIYIDGSFLFHCAQNLNLRIDYRKLRNFFTNPGDHIVGVCYYTALPADSELSEQHKSFLKVLKKELKIRVRSVPLLRAPSYEPLDETPDGFVVPPSGAAHFSKGEDILLACDMIRGAYTNSFDVAILVTGDGDFVPAVQQVIEAGKKVIIASFRGSLSQALEIESSENIYLDDHLHHIRLVDSSKRPHVVRDNSHATVRVEDIRSVSPISAYTSKGDDEGS